MLLCKHRIINNKTFIMRMKRTFQLAFTTMLMLSAASCVNNEHDFMDEPKLPETECFDFKTKMEVTLNIDYGYEGYSVPFEVFTTNPLDESGAKIEDKSPIFAAFTNGNCSFTGDITLPSHAKTIYLYSDALAIPTVLELEVSNGRAEYVYQSPTITTRNISYSGDCYNIGSNKATIDNNNKLYALYDNYIKYVGPVINKGDVIYRPWNSKQSNLYSIVDKKTQLTSSSTLGQLISRVNNTLKDRTDNSAYCSDTKHTNLRIAKTTENGEEVESAHIDLVFLAAGCSYHNAMGYYYYPSDQTLTGDEIKALPKFMVFPRTTSNKPDESIKARIQFFGDDYNQEGVDNFPPGYTIGWVLIADIIDPNLFANESLSDINKAINTTYTKKSVYSNREANIDQNYGCVTLSDAASERIIIGFEDNAFKTGCGDKSYQDILFYVECDPIDAIFDPERPEIIDKPDPEVFRTQTQTSTLAYEDIWPTGGDYDMNDVVVELINKITFNQYNMIKRIETKVKAAHCGATFTNAFGFVINGEVGDVVEEESDYFAKEESDQFIFFDNIIKNVGKNFTLVRTFGENGIDKSTHNSSYKPFIVVNYEKDKKSRTEVHLPEATPTSWIDQSLIGQGRDLFYVDKDGKYPFAIELFDVKDWEVVTEKSRIGSDGEYAGFIKWVESYGQSNKDWYLNK